MLKVKPTNQHGCIFTSSAFFRNKTNQYACLIIMVIWSPYGIGQTIIFLPCGYFFLLFSFS